MTEPRVLLLTSSFPQNPADPTADFLRRYVESVDLPGTVLTPEGAGAAAAWSVGRMRVRYVPYWLPRTAQRVAHGWGITENLRTHPWTHVQLPSLIAAWTATAIKAAAHHDVVVAHWALPTGLVGVASSVATDLPLVTVLHSGGVHALSRIFGGRFVARSLARRSAALVASSSFVRDKFTGLLGPGVRESVRDGTEVLPMGFTFPEELSPRCPARRDRPSTVLFLGRVNEIKGLDVLIDACAALSGVTIHVAGYGPLLDAARQTATELGVEAVFHGQVTGELKSRLLRESDMLVLPSRVLSDGTTEGLPVALLEAMGHGTPVVATAVGGVPDVVRDGVEGLLVPPDDPEALARAIQSVLSDPAAAQARARAARQTASEFSWPTLGARHRGVIERAARFGTA